MNMVDVSCNNFFASLCHLSDSQLLHSIHVSIIRLLTLTYVSSLTCNDNVRYVLIKLSINDEYKCIRAKAMDSHQTLERLD